MLVIVVLRSVIPAPGILIVASQVYSPLSDNFNGENMCTTDRVLPALITVEFGKIIFMSGSTSRAGTMLAEHSKVYLWPAIGIPVDDRLTPGAGRPISKRTPVHLIKQSS